MAECEEEILNSLDGVVQYESDVFWIPHTSYIYDEIHTWKPVVGSSAGELLTVKEIQYDLQDFLYVQDIISGTISYCCRQS